MISIGQISAQASEPLGSHMAPLSLPKYPDFDLAAEAGHSLLLIAKENQLALASADLGEKASLEIDFYGGSLGHRRQFGGGRNQDICRAVGLNKQTGLSICDATAGLGRDAFVMASQGARVLGMERNPVLASMLDWALIRAKLLADQEKDEDLIEVLDCLEFRQADSGSELRTNDYDVVYLDPMFPTRGKSALVKKEMQILHQLLGESQNCDKSLFAACLSAAESRLVVKRPVKSECFAGQKPNHQIVGKTIRYDVYVNKALP